MRHRLDRTLRLLIVMNIIVVGILALTMVADWAKVLPSVGGETAAPGASIEPSATAEQMQMGLAHIPTSNSCLLCHKIGRLQRASSRSRRSDTRSRAGPRA